MIMISNGLHIADLLKAAYGFDILAAMFELQYSGRVVRCVGNLQIYLLFIIPT